MKKILVINDDEDIRDIMRLILDNEEYEVNEVANGHEVNSAISTTRPDVILLDVLLGDADGRDICRELKNDEATADIPVIIVSATHANQAMYEKGCRADDYISKPFDIDDLIKKVSYYAAA